MPDSADRTPRPAVDAPHAAGEAPHALGDAPHAVGDAPHAVGDAPSSVRSYPNTTGEAPYGNGVGRAVSVAGSLQRKRTWLLLLVAVFVVGSLDLLLWGWRPDAPLMFLTGVAIGAFAVGRQAGRTALGLSVLVLLVYGLIATDASVTSPATWVSGTVALLIGGLLILWIEHRLVEQSEVALARARQEARSLAKTVLDTRFDALQTTNQRLTRRTQLLEATLDVMEALSATYDVPALLNVAVESIAAHFGFPLVTVYLMDDSVEALVLRDASSVEGRDLAVQGLRLREGSDGPVSWVAAQRQPRVMSYIERQEQESGYLAALAPPNTQLTVTLPLSGRQRTLGVLDLYLTDGRAPSAEDLTIFEKLSDALASAIQSAQRAGDGGMATGILSPVYETVVELARARSEAEVHRVLLDAIGPYQPARVLVIESPAPEGPRSRGSQGMLEQLKVACDWYRGEMIAEPYDLTESGMMAASRGASVYFTPSLVDVAIFGVALDAPLWVWDLSDLGMALSPELRGALAGLSEGLGGSAVAEPGALAFLPTRGEDEVDRGGILILYEGAHPFSATEKQLHRVLSDLGGTALRRSQLVADVARRAGREGTLAAVRARLQRSLDPETVLRTTIAELGRVLNAELATIEISPGSMGATYASEAVPVSTEEGDGADPTDDRTRAEDGNPV